MTLYNISTTDWMFLNDNSFALGKQNDWPAAQVHYFLILGSVSRDTSQFETWASSFEERL